MLFALNQFNREVLILMLLVHLPSHFVQVKFATQSAFSLRVNVMADEAFHL